jgi:hypothetical protein
MDRIKVRSFEGNAHFELVMLLFVFYIYIYIYERERERERESGHGEKSEDGGCSTKETDGLNV